MWSEIFIGYGVFILEVITLLLIVAAVVTTVISIKQKKHTQQGELVITDLSQAFEETGKALREFHLSEEELKAVEKAEKKAEKMKAKALKAQRKKGEATEEEQKPTLYVLHFKGDIAASETMALREEISAIIQTAKSDDEVLLCLESPGGMVHGYGLAASQLARLKQHGIKLTVAVDKVAASGGYMMACVADKIVSAPFAIIGSIGVVAQGPNLHRLLKKHDVDVDVMTAGEYKRTVTILGENTEKGKQKFQQDLMVAVQAKDNKKIQEAIDTFNNSVKNTIASLESLKIQSASINEVKEQTKTVLSLASDLLVDQANVSLSEPTEEQQKAYLAKAEKLKDAMAKLQEQSLALEKKFNGNAKAQ